jgi:hypothetical protein
MASVERDLAVCFLTPVQPVKRIVRGAVIPQPPEWIVFGMSDHHHRSECQNTQEIFYALRYQ